MIAGLNITSRVTIQEGTVYKNGQLVFEQPGSPINKFLPALYKTTGLNYPKFYKMDNLCKLGLLASGVLLQEFDKGLYDAEKTGVILCNANSSLDADLKYWQSAQDVASPAMFVYTLPNIVIGEICIRHGFKGEHAFYVMPEFDKSFIHQQVEYLFENNIIDAAICGWVDVLDADYNAQFFLIERGSNGSIFTTENLI